MQSASPRPRRPARRATHESAPPEPVPLRGCRVSEPLMQLWGERCRIIEWTHPEGGNTRLAVPGSATPAQIEQQLRAHRAGLRYVANDGLAPSRAQVLLGY